MIHILNYGMGVESTAILLRWMLEENTQSLDLSELLVLTAQTGDEFEDTKELVETHIFPLMREREIRFVEAARNGPSIRDGYIELNDSRRPTTLHIEGEYRLSDNLIVSGTVPRLGRPHLCAIRFKGEVLDAWIKDNVDQPFGPYIGYNVDETKRADKSSDYGCRGENYRYPLIEWGWTREKCLAYIYSHFGVVWKKSCCQYCPFQSRDAAVARFLEQPKAGAFALWIGGLAMALNPRMHLFSSGTVYDICVEGGCSESLKLYQDRLEREEFALYRVRRIYTANGTTARTTVNARRNVETIDRGTQAQMEALLCSNATLQGLVVETTGGWSRYYVYRKGEGYPTIEEFFVVCPGAIKDKCQCLSRFEQDWSVLSGEIKQLSLLVV